jgi:hypothetical protein
VIRRGSQEIHDAIRKGLDQVSRKLASGKPQGSGRFYTDEELEKGAATGEPKKRQTPEDASVA